MEFIEDMNLKNKKVILRLDLNVTIKDNHILDDTKIRKSIPTIKYLLNNNNNVLIMSHLGKIKSEEDKLNNSLRIVCKKLSELLNINIKFIEDTRSPELEKCLINNSLCMMENTRFEDFPKKLESGCDMELSKYWASIGDIFINDAFGTTHRKHASNFGISKYLTSGYGFLINEEINGLKPVIKKTKEPFTVIMGGSKVDDKIQLIENILNECNYLLVGGGIANTFLKSQGYNVGLSLYSRDYIEPIRKIYEKYKDKIWMPVDVVVESHGESVTKSVDNVVADDCIYDIGPNTVEIYNKIIKISNTIFTNGTMGMYENKKYRSGTEKIYRGIINDDEKWIIAGGGDAVASIHKLGYEDKFDYISTGGGATLEYIATKKIRCFDEK